MKIYMVSLFHRATINKRTIFLVRVTGRMNRVALVSRDKADVSRRGKVNDTGKRTADRYLEKMTLKVGAVCKNLHQKS